MLGTVYQTEPYKITIIQLFWALKHSKFLWLNLIFQHRLHKLLKINYGLSYLKTVSLYPREHLQNVVHERCIQEMFVEVKSVGLFKLPLFFIRQLIIDDLKILPALWATPF